MTHDSDSHAAWCIRTHDSWFMIQDIEDIQGSWLMTHDSWPLRWLHHMTSITDTNIFESHMRLGMQWHKSSWSIKSKDFRAWLRGGLLGASFLAASWCYDVILCWSSSVHDSWLMIFHDSGFMICDVCFMYQFLACDSWFMLHAAAFGLCKFEYVWIFCMTRFALKTKDWQFNHRFCIFMSLGKCYWVKGMYVRCCSCNNEDMRSENMRLQLEFDATTQMLRVMDGAASFPIMIQRWGLSWIETSQAVLQLALKASGDAVIIIIISITCKSKSSLHHTANLDHESWIMTWVIALPAVSQYYEPLSFEHRCSLTIQMVDLHDFRV